MDGKYVEGRELNPNYVLAKNGKRLSRIWVIGTAVKKYSMPEKNFYTLTVDDGTSTIRAKAFGSKILEKFREGDIVEVIGKLRKYAEEVYIVPEVVWKTGINAESLRELDIKKSQEEWKRKTAMVIEYRKQSSDAEELKNLCADMGVSSEDVEGILEAQESIEAGQQERKMQVLNVIDELDAGDGCDYSALIEKAGIQESELDTVVQELLDEGSCFEPRPGKIKKV